MLEMPDESEANNTEADNREDDNREDDSQIMESMENEPLMDEEVGGVFPNDPPPEMIDVPPPGGDETPPMMMEELPSPDVNPPPEDCVTHEEFFDERAWRDVLRPLCFDCHNPQGIAQVTDMVYVPEGQPGSLESNLAEFSEVAEFERDGDSIVLLKPIMQIAHGGGLIFERDSESFQILAEMIERTQSEEVICEREEEEVLGLSTQIELLTAQETLRKATLTLNGRLPTATEEAEVEAQGWGGVESALHQILNEERFYIRLKEIWNDILLTDVYLGRTRAVDLLREETYPEARWFLEDSAPSQEDFYWAARDYTNDSLAREPLEHIAFIVRSNRPFTEIIASDYIAMNPYTARMYGVGNLTWRDPIDPNEYQPARAAGIPHAGILTSPMFLNRFPTTDTNRNRHRARIFYKLFLDLDIFKLAERPIDPSSTVHNPTLNDPQCTICHTVVDPVAGAFQHWDERGGLMFREAWYGDMLAPGFNELVLPYDNRSESLRWLALQAVGDPRFDRSIVKLMYEALVGSLLPEPQDDSFIEERSRAYDEQQRYINDLAVGFRANHHNLKWLIRTLIRSPYFRAKKLRNDGADVVMLRDAGELDKLSVLFAGFGGRKPLTPEQLNRKIIATMGARWRQNINRTDYLLSENQYRLLYGGIDSDDVVERITEPNGIFANIQLRMANEVACMMTAYDFTKESTERSIFPWVETSFVPEDSNGFPIPDAQEKIKQNIQSLGWRLWGERWDIEDSELMSLYQLYVDIWRAGKLGVDEDNLSSNLTYSCQGRVNLITGESLANEERVIADPNYTIRAWEALLSVFLSDDQFLYQ